MYSLYVPHIRLRACIQRGVFIMLLEYLQNRLRSRTRMQNVRSHVVRETVRSASSAPRRKRARTGSKTTVFANGIFSFSIFKNLVRAVNRQPGFRAEGMYRRTIHFAT